MKYIILFILLGVFLISSVSAMKIDFYYSPTCPHCQNVIPSINLLTLKYHQPDFLWTAYDVSQTSYDIAGVPFIRIKTDDCRTVEIGGDTPIIQKLPCELQQMSTPQCKTYPAETNHKGSWFS